MGKVKIRVAVLALAITENNKSSMEDKRTEVMTILQDYFCRDTPLDVATDSILRLFGVSGSLPSFDPLDDENSEIYKIGREIAEMSDEEFEANCKAFEKMIKRSKGNER